MVTNDPEELVEITPDQIRAIEATLKSCPFHNRPFLPKPFLCDEAWLDGVFVSCDCGARGPVGATDQEAAELWNARS